MIYIRPYRESDFQIIASWWIDRGEIGPMPGMMIEDGTFVAEFNGTPTMSLTVFLTQSKEIAYIEGYICRPGVAKEVSHPIGQALWEHCFKFAKDSGYRRVICFTEKPSLVHRYENIGMRRSLGGLQSLVKEL